MRKHRWLLLLMLVVAIGAVFRFYQLGDWLHFELDQARDARVVDVALEGSVLDLPLLGPKAGGTFLRLGPGFYWLEYLGALLFGGAVVGSATMVALSSVLAIPLFYLIAKRIFVTSLAMMLTVLFSVSTYLVLYGRFAWNPNFIPFFSLLGFYALLRVVDGEETRKGWWLMLSALAIGLATHMHFLAFLGLPTVAILFFLLRRPCIALRFWVGAFTVIALLYMPVALNEVATGGQNAKEFMGAVFEKSTKEERSLVEKSVRNISEFGLHAIVMLTGFEGATFPAIEFNDGNIGSVCDSKCDAGKWYGVAGIFLLWLSALLLLWRWHQTETGRKKDVLLLMILWFVVSFVLFLPLSYGIAPRFFLLNAPVFFLMLGVLMQCFGRLLVCNNLLQKWLPFCVIAILVFMNVHFLSLRFNELARAGSEPVSSAPDRILKERVRVTLEQQRAIVDFLERRFIDQGVPIYMFSEPQHRRALKYLMERRGIENDVLGFSSIYREGAYFLIVRAQSDVEDALQKYRSDYVVAESVPFGTLVVIELVPREESIVAERQDFSVPEKKGSSQAPPRYTLREFLERAYQSRDDEDGEDE